MTYIEISFWQASSPFRCHLRLCDPMDEEYRGLFPKPGPESEEELVVSSLGYLNVWKHTMSPEHETLNVAGST